MRFKTTKEMRDNFSKCIDKGIRIYPIPTHDKSNLYYTEVDFGNKKPLRTKEPLKENECWDLIFRYYKHYAK